MYFSLGCNSTAALSQTTAPAVASYYINISLVQNLTLYQVSLQYNLTATLRKFTTPADVRLVYNLTLGQVRLHCTLGYVRLQCALGQVMVSVGVAMEVHHTRPMAASANVHGGRAQGRGGSLRKYLGKSRKPKPSQSRTITANGFCTLKKMFANIITVNYKKHTPGQVFFVVTVPPRRRRKHYATVVEVTCFQGQLEKNVRPGTDIIRRRFKSTGSAKIFGARSQTIYNFQRNSSACGNFTLLATDFRLFHLCLCVPYRLAPRAAARL